MKTDAGRAGRQERRRRSMAVGLIAAAGLLAPLAVGAQADYPNKPVKFIVNFPPGGPLDMIARSMAERLTATMKQPFIVENRGGAAGNIGADAVAKSAPDGYTVLFTIDTTLTVNPTLYPSMPFKPADLMPLMLLATSGLAVGVQPSLGIGSMAELVARGKTQELTFSSAGNGSPGHLAAALLSDKYGLKINHVPYRGNTQAVMAVVGNEVQAGVLATPGFAPHIPTGKVKVLAVTGKNRSPLLPDVPTSAQANVPALEIEVGYLAMLPAGTPPAIAARLHKEMSQALALPEVQQRLRTVDLVATPTDGPALADRLAATRERYAATIRATKMKVE